MLVVRFLFVVRVALVVVGSNVIVLTDSFPYLATTTVPSVLCFIANIELTSIAVKSSGTVQPQRSASRREPICTERQLAQIVATVKTICTITSVIGSGSAMIAILLKTDMPADESR